MSLETGTLLKLKDNTKIYWKKWWCDSKILPFFEVGYSNLSNSNKFYDIIPLHRCSPIEAIFSMTSFPFFVEIEKDKLSEFFEIVILSQEAALQTEQNPCTSQSA